MTYPNSAGYTNKTTSKEAADKINMQYPRQKFAIEDYLSLVNIRHIRLMK